MRRNQCFAEPWFNVSLVQWFIPTARRNKLAGDHSPVTTVVSCRVSHCQAEILLGQGFCFRLNVQEICSPSFASIAFVGLRLQASVKCEKVHHRSWFLYLNDDQCPLKHTFGEDMSDADMSTDSLEDCGVDLQFGDQTLDNLAGSLLGCTGENKGEATRHSPTALFLKGFHN